MKKETLNLGISAEAPFAAGYEKDIYEHHETKKIVKITQNDLEGKFLPGNQRYIKAEMYLTKILHLLFPKNIPDMHVGSFAHKASVHEKMEMDSDHTEFRDYVLKTKKHPTEVTEKEKQGAFSAYHKLEEYTTGDSFINTCRDLGLVIDGGARNYGRDLDGNTVYVDSILPWEPAHRHLPNLPFKTYFDAEGLSKLIAVLPESDREHAQHYFERLITLADEERVIHDALNSV